MKTFEIRIINAKEKTIQKVIPKIETLKKYPNNLIVFINTF